MHIAVRAISVTLGGAVLALAPLSGASAHVHGINPLTCTPAAPNAGALQTHQTPAWSLNGGPISGVIPVVRGNVEPREPAHFGVCR